MPWASTRISTTRFSANPVGMYEFSDSGVTVRIFPGGFELRVPGGKGAYVSQTSGFPYGLLDAELAHHGIYERPPISERSVLEP